MPGTTEDAASRHRGMDTWSTEDLLAALWGGQMQAVAACLAPIGGVAAAVEAVARRLAAGRGRLVYVGAGSSGLIAALDALELGDTFGWPDDRLAILRAGGLDLAEGLAGAAEDATDAALAGADALGFGPDDVVIAVSASGASAYTVTAVGEARRHGALTIGLTAMAGSDLATAAELPLVVATGAEVLAGSTRMGAGTAQKVILNLISTAVMTRLGAVHDNLMVDVRPVNAKLRRRCIAIVARIAEVDPERAGAALARYGEVKRAVLALAGAAPTTLDDRLAAAGGRLRDALAVLRAETPSPAGGRGAAGA